MKLTEHLKSSVTIDQVVGELGGLNLRKRGNNLQGPCPTGHPSKGGQCFSVNTVNNFFHCFNCGEGGDIFSLVSLAKSVDFKEALRWTVEKFKPEYLPQVDKQKEYSPQQKAYSEKGALYEKIMELYKPYLYTRLEAKEALSYLIQERGYTEEGLKLTEWFFFPPDNQIRYDLQRDLPEAEDQIKSLSLQGYYGDNFRLAFPYRDRHGVITGFLKRASKADGTDIKGKKGVRWDSTKGLKKTDLFNLKATRGQEELLILEGYPDALYFPTLGIKKVVAVGQGLLSTSHIEGLQVNKVNRVILSFDNDPPKETGVVTGIENTERALELLGQTDITVFVIDPPKLAPHKDPDEFVGSEGIEAFRELMRTAENGARWKARRLLQKHDTDTDRGKEAVIREFLEFDNSLPSSRAREGEEALKVISEKMEISMGSLQAEREGLREKKEKERQKKRLKELKRKAHSLIEAGDLDTLHELIGGELRAQAPDVKGIEPYTLKDVVKELQETPPGLKTSYSKLDEYVRIPQEGITIIAGRPSHGKTTFLMNLLLNMVTGYPDKSFVFMTYEEPKKMIAIKLINILSKEILNDPRDNLIQVINYIKGEATGNDKLEHGKTLFTEFTQEERLLITGTPYKVNEIENVLSGFQERTKKGIGAVFIDYIQKISIQGSFPTRQLELQKISNELLEIAKNRLHIPIILGCQLGRPQSGSATSAIRLDNLREAGDLENDAKLVLMLHNPSVEEEGEGKAKPPGARNLRTESEISVYIKKNRDGVVNKMIPFTFNKPILFMSDE